MDRYRERRSPERARESRYTPGTQIDSYIPSSSSRASRPRSRSPSGYRARSRTPPRTTDSYRGRPASPPRRHDSRTDSYTSRNARPRSPRRDYPTTDSRYDTTSKSARERSPPPLKRTRELSPPLRGGRSPARDSRTSYRPRSRSPRREERADTYMVKSWRRSQSPRGDSGRNSGATSRRSSPRAAHPRRPTDSVTADDSRNPSSYRSPRPRSPPIRRDSPLARTTTPYRNETERDLGSNGQSYSREVSLSMSGPDQRDRLPPTGPSGLYRETQPAAMAVPTGPSSPSIPASAHSRHGPPTAPAYGRGAYGGGFRGRGGPPPPRDYTPSGRGQSTWSSPSTYGRGAGQTTGPPTGPAAASGMGRDAYPVRDASSGYDHHRGGPARRGSSYNVGAFAYRGSGNGTSATTPRTQRFNQAMSGVAEIKAGGEKLPALHDTTKAERLEEEAAKLRKLIDDREIKKRQGLKEWDKLERESANAALRSELAEEHLRSLNGEGEGMAAAF